MNDLPQRSETGRVFACRDCNWVGNQHYDAAIHGWVDSHSTYIMQRVEPISPHRE